MTVRYWIGVVASDHARHAIDKGICAFAKGTRSAIAKLSEGDRFAYYSPKTGFMSGDPVQAFTALGTVIDTTPFEHDWDGHQIWVCRAAYAALPHTSVRPLLPSLAFVTNKDKWGMAFRRGMFEIGEADFDRIEAAMKGSAT